MGFKKVLKVEPRSPGLICAAMYMDNPVIRNLKGANSMSEGNRIDIARYIYGLSGNLKET